MSIFIPAILALFSAVQANCPFSLVFTVGSYTNQPWLPLANGTGVSFVTFNTRFGLKPSADLLPTLTGENPSYTARLGQYLYAVNENENGGISQLQFSNRLPYIKSMNRSTGSNAASSSPTHVSVISNLQTNSEIRFNVLTANFGGSVSSFIKTNNALFLADQFIIPKWVGSGRDKTKLNSLQNGPHAHMVLPYKSGVIVPDLGSDFVFQLSLNRTTGKLTEINRVNFFAGDGPRHAVAHPTSDTVYVANEFSSTITTLRPGCEGKPLLGKCGRKNILNPAGALGASASAIRVSANGLFLYVSIRYPAKAGKIVAFRLNKVTGDIVNKIGEYSSGGIHPRDFWIVERANIAGGCKSFIAIVNRDSNNMIIRRRLFGTGALAPMGPRYITKLLTPVSVMV